ncbi:MAG: hypothetical protein HYU41_11265 [Candidatus Rokubacteria bacterium]|nr:hypothetical protein [Candidatus Rokubacteria bacterium]
MRRAAALGLLSLCVACTPGAPRSATGAASDRGGPADLVVRYTATPGSPFEIGKWYRRWARYGITVTNHGSGVALATMLTVTFGDGRPGFAPMPVDPKVFAASAGTCAPRTTPQTPRAVMCRLGNIAPGDTVTVEVGARAHYTGSLHATAEVTSAADPTTDNNTAKTETSLKCEGCGGK